MADTDTTDKEQADLLGQPILSVRPSWRGLLRHLLLVVFLGVVIGLLMSFTLWYERGDWGGFGDWLLDNVIVVHVIGYILMAVAAYVLVKLLTKRWSMKLTLYPDRVTLTKGILSRDVKVLFCADIRTINVRKSLIQRMLHVGDIMIATAGTEGYEDEAFGIANPIRLKNQILRLKAAATGTDD